MVKAVFGIVFVLGSVAFSVAAQPKDANELSATDGVLLPSLSVTEVDNAAASALNPANLGFLESWNLFYTGAWTQRQQRLAGQGHGFFFGIPIGPIGFGISVEPLMPSLEIAQWQGLGHRTRFSLSLSANFKRMIGLGITYRTFWFDSFAPLHTMDLALSVRPSNHLALSFVFSDVNSPRFQYRYLYELDDNTYRWSSTYDHRAPRKFTVGLTIRPLGNDRLAVGGELRYLHGEADSRSAQGGASYARTDLTAFLSGMPVNGLSLKMRFTAEGIGHSYDTGFILDGAIGLDLPNFGLGTSFHGQVGPSNSAGYQATSWYAVLHGDKAPSLPLPKPFRSAHVVVMDINEPLDSYNFASLAASFERMEKDKSVDMLLFRPDPKVLSLAQAEETRSMIRRIQNTSKQVICYLTEASSAEYLACAGADRVWINPAGGIRMAGVSMTAFYLGDLAKKVGVNADMVRIGKYKSAPETYTQNQPSEPAVEEADEYLDDVYASMISTVQTLRKFKTPEAARKVIERGPFTAPEAVANQLVDESVPKDMLEAKLYEMIGSHVFFDTEYHNDTIRHRRYIDSPAVAVVHITGDIVDGKSVDIPIINIKMTGAQTLTETLRAIGADNRIRAVVLRINSPGGSAMGSDILWREVAALRREKPVIVSMDSVAASGAYYIASAADKIYANAVTLTGSIGIYYGKTDLSALLERIGVNAHTFKKGEHADIQSWTRPYSESEKEQILRQISQFYNLFLQRVSEGRGKDFTPQKVDELGQGRIWSGTDAQYHLLADEIGGYTDALAYARSLIGSHSDIPVFHYPKQSKSLVVRLLSSMTSKIKQQDSLIDMIRLTGTGRIVKSLAPFAVGDPLSPRARLPFVSLEE